MRFPRRKALIVLAVGGLLVATGASAQAGWLFVMAAGVLGLLAGSLLVPARLAGCALAREVPKRATAGDEVLVGMSLRNNGRRTTGLARLEDRFGGFDPASFVCEPVPPGGTAVARVARRARLRGVFEGGEVLLRGSAPFGFFSTRRRCEVVSRMTVVPRAVDLRGFPILEPASAPRDVLHERARTGAGEEYLGVRPYRPGDPRRFVHWRSSARAGKLVVREYEEQVQSQVVLLLSGSDHGARPDSSFEALVSAAASIGNYALVTGHPVEILAPRGGEVLRLARPSRMGMLEWLAQVEAWDQSLMPMIDRCLPRMARRGTVVLLAASAGAAGAGLTRSVQAVQASGARAAVVVARSSTWGAEVPGEEPLLRALGAGRAALRVLLKGKDLRSCLQG